MEEYTLNIVDIFGFPKMRVVLGIKLYLVCTLEIKFKNSSSRYLFYNNPEKLKKNGNFHVNLIFNKIGFLM